MSRSLESFREAARRSNEVQRRLSAQRIEEAYEAVRKLEPKTEEELLWELVGMKGCPTCGSMQIYHIKADASRSKFMCVNSHSFSPLTGTIYQHSGTLLTNWRIAETLLKASGGKVNARQISRVIGVRHNTALRMRARILERGWHEH
jgi:transposase-like protein